MKKMFTACIAGAIMLGQLQTGLAASDKCTVVEVKGKRMVIDCEQRTKGFSEGSRIKIKTDTSKHLEGC